MSEAIEKESVAENAEILELARRWKDKRGSLIMALHDLQGRHGYVPRDAAMGLARELDVPLARIYEVVTFYNFFKLTPPGRHIISVCMGTACYLKGAPALLEEATRQTGASPGQTSADGQYHLQMVRCVGCCGLAPVILADGVTIAKADRDKVRAHLCQCSGNSKEKEQECLV